MKVKICEVVAQSSESPDGPAVNVLNDSKNKVWLANADETAILLIQLEKVSAQYSRRAPAPPGLSEPVFTRPAADVLYYRPSGLTRLPSATTVVILSRSLPGRL